MTSRHADPERREGEGSLEEPEGFLARWAGSE